MSLERMLQVTVAALLTLGTLLLGIGQGSVLLPLLAAVAAIGSVWLTDVKGVVRLKQYMATMLALSTLGMFAIDLLRLGKDNQLLAIANLLVYLQVVLQFQRKDMRIYWQLLMLSLLQVVVAAALSLSLWFGPLVLIYLFLGLLALAQFFALRESQRFQPATTAGRAALAEPSDFAADRSSGAFTMEGFRPVSREDLARGGIGRDLARHVTGHVLVTLLMAAALFYIIPRFQTAPLISNALASQTMIGYNETVTLGHLGEALQDRSSVMRVWFSDSVTGQPYPVAEEPLFRGAVVDTYKNQKWNLHQSDLPGGEPHELRDAPAIRGNYVLQQIALEEQRESTAFSVMPAYRLDNSCPIEEDPRRQQLIRKTRRGRLEFTLATTGLAGGKQVKIVPALTSLKQDERARLLGLPAADDQGRDPLPRMKQLASKAVSSVPEANRIDRARALLAALGPSQGFEYSLGSVNRDPSIDLVEDFVAVNKRGHCEYFASALTLMLRSQGIPARMVIGFKGGEFNSLGNYYQVRMLHAHTWVEAYLEPDQLPAEIKRRSAGGWLKLDPTPGSDDPAEGRSLTLAEKARDWMDYGDYLWMNYVVGLDQRRQQEAVFTPLSVGGYSIGDLFNKRFWTRTVPRFFRSLWRVETWKNLAQSLNWWLVARTVALLMTSYLSWRYRRFLAGYAKKLWTCVPLRPRATKGRAARKQALVPFYEQLESLLARHGIRRPESQTQHEFAMAARGQLSETPRLAPAAMLPGRVVDAFYRVRFGRHALDKTETEAVELSLRELEAALAQ